VNLKSNNIYNKIIKQEGQIAILVDPDKFDAASAPDFIKKVEAANIDYLFIGGSTVDKEIFDTVLVEIKKLTNLPVICFPGDVYQYSEKADALLYLSLLSGRNPDYLIGHHLRTSVQIFNSDIETIPTAYLLIDGDNHSDVSYVSQTMPIPSDQLQLTMQTAIAGVLQGKKIVYLDAGSGAKKTVPSLMVNSLRKKNIPVIVGGGIQTIEKIEEFKASGANLIVIGNHIEENIDFLLDIKNYQEKQQLH
jgi:phosphoglycerol geranylgeranyltransferase